MAIDLKQLREKFHYKRWSSRLTFEDVAKETRVSASTLYRFEQNKTAPQLEQFIAIADWLGMDLVLIEKEQPDEQS